MPEVVNLHDSVAFIQHAIDKNTNLVEAKEELEAALEKWPTSPQLLDAQAYFAKGDAA